MRSSKVKSSGSRKDLSHFYRPYLETHSTASESPQPILPQGHPISRKEIIRRCSKSEEDSVTKYNGSLRSGWRRPSEKQENSRSDLSQDSSFRRPTTLPSIRKRLSNESTGYPRRVSRQEIIKRRSGPDDLHEGSQRRKSYSGIDSEFREHPRTPFVKNISGFSRSRILARSREIHKNSGAEDSRSVCEFGNSEVGTLLPRPSTLPKITHSGKSSRYNEDRSLARSNMELGKKEAGIYGRIRRRKASLPNVSHDQDVPRTTSRDQDVSRRSSGRYGDMRKQVSGSRDSISTSEISFQRKTYRSIRDPVNDPVYRPRSLLDLEEVERKGGVIYRRAASSRNFQGHEDGRESRVDNERRNPDDVCTVHRTMSRRRIISNVEVRDSKTVKKKKARNFLEPENEDEVYSHTLPGTSYDLERIKRRRSLIGKNNNPPKGNLKTENPDRFRWSKSIIGDLESRTSFCEFPSDRGDESVSRTLPTYVKKSRNSFIPLRIDTKSHSSITLKLTKERTNQVRKSVGSHARTFSDANSARSNSPGMSTSIFAFCTGKRKITSRIPSKVKDGFYRNRSLKRVR